MKRLFEIIVFVCCLKFSFCQDCPYFRYVESNGATVGKIEFPNDFSGSYRLNVNMTMAAFFQHNPNIRLELRTVPNDVINGHPLVYFVYFPTQDVLPRVTRIEFNNRVYCTGVAEQVRPGVGVTNFWATTYFGSSQSVSVQHNQQPQRPVVISNFIPQTTTTPLQLFTIPSKTKTTTTTPFIERFTQLGPFVTERATQRPFQTQRATEQSVYVQTQPARPTTERPYFSQAVTQIINQGVSQKVTFTNKSTIECGYISSAGQHLVANGDEVTEGQFPWMSAIMYKLTKNSQYQYKCTGSLVSNQHIVTAAHCIQYEKALLFPLDDLLAVLAKTDIEDWNIRSLQSKISHVNVHPDYKSNSGDSDVAVFTLTTPVRITVHVKPICLWSGNEDVEEIVGTQGTVAGWGSDESGRATIAEARFVRMPIVSQVECLLSNPKFRTLTSNKTFCAGNRNGSGPCNGDSGAGFIIKINDRWTLRGIVSRSLNDVNTCDLQNYFVFADLAKVSEWLRAAIA